MNIKFGTIDYPVKFVDISAGTNGTGDTLTDPMNTFPILSGLTETMYICRRVAGTHYTLPTGTSSIQKLMIIGIPKATDEFFELMPNNVQISSWVNDSADYAEFAVPNSRLTISYCKDLLFSRVNLFRDNGVTVSQWMLYNTNTTMASNWSFIDCKFDTKSYDLFDDAMTDSVTPNKANYYMYMQTANSFVMKRCDISTGHSSSYRCFQVHYSGSNSFNNIIIKDCNVRCLTSHYDIQIFYFYGNEINSNIKIENLDCKYYINGTQSRSEYYPQLFYCGNRFNYTYIRNITVSDVKILSTAPAQMRSSRDMIKIGTHDYDIKNININLQYCWLNERDGCLFYLGSDWNNDDSTLREKILEDIDIKMADVNGIGNNNSSAEVRVYGVHHYYSVVKLYGSAGISTTSPFIIKNIDIDTPRCRALYVQHAIIKNATISGAIAASTSVIDIDNYSSWFPDKTIAINGGTVMNIDNITMNKTNPDYPFTDESVRVNDNFSYHGFLYANTSNVRLADTITYNGTDRRNDNHCSICDNEIITGNYVNRSKNMSCVTSSIYRTNGATASLYFSNNTTASAPGEIAIGKRPASGMKVTPPSIGNFNLILYTASHNIATAMASKNFRIELDVPTTETENCIYNSNIDGQWVSDTSEWNTLTGETQYKLIIPITVGYLRDIDVRMFFNWYSSVGGLYVDPIVVLEAR